ncbi:MAG: glycoside hydrolase family 88 protein [Eubacteriales bacterium]|nr:glycoside hydrolase family 88 protein [Eubacteriales bacterium]
MKKLQSPLCYAQAACDTMMRRYPAPDLPPKGHFHYHQGVFLSGMLNTWKLCKDSRYLDYAAQWVRAVFTPEGEIRQYDHADLDDIQPGILLYSLYDATGDAFYLRCIESTAKQIPDIPRCACGGFWHKVSMPNQMWLDGLYMAGPFLAEYARRFDRPEWRELIVKEILLMREHTCDPATGLWKHAWDESRQAEWCDPATGLAPEFWGRSIGWVPVAVQDVLRQMEPADRGFEELQALTRSLLLSVRKYQSADGRWYQVVDKGGQPGNWLENSCSCLFSAALSRAYITRLMGQEALTDAMRAFVGVRDSLEWDGENLLIGNVCIGTGVGDYTFYCERPCSVNDLHGVGAFLLMCTELQQALDQAAPEN